MKSNSSNILNKKKKQMLESWMQIQLQDEGLREDLISNEELRVQSDELLSSMLRTLQSDNHTDSESPEFEELTEMLSGIAINRAKQGFSARETSTYVISLKDAMIQVIENEYKDDFQKLYQETSKVI